MQLAEYENLETQIAVKPNQVSTSTDIEETYTVIVQEEKQGVPSQPMDSAGMTHSYIKLNELRPPWVPAPAKASKSSIKSEGAAAQEQDFPIFESSSSSMGSFKMQSKPKPVITPSTSANKVKLPTHSTTVGHKHKRDHRPLRKSVSKLKTVKHGGRRVETGGYRLQSKDSLVDVTACLQAKREEVMKLWEKNLFQDDPGLIAQLEKANRLALEAAEEVESLRRVIQDFQDKEEGLSNQDCKKLEQMRTKVLGKVQEFEKADNDLQITIEHRSSTKASQSASKTSQTDTDKIIPISYKEIMPRPRSQVPDGKQSHRPLRKSKSTLSCNDFVFLKQKNDNFSEESVSDYGGERVNQQHPMSLKSIGPTVLTSLEELSRLNLMYEEKLTFPPINDISNLASQSKVSLEGLTHMQSKRTTSFTNPQCDSESEVTVAEEMLCREQISYLQKSLLDTEQEVEELKSELERIESEGNFRVRLLQNSVEDKFDSLKVIPEYLQMLDSKLEATMEIKCKLEEDLREKDIRLRSEREQNRHLKKESEEMQKKLKATEISRDLLSHQNADLEKTNQQLRREIEGLTKQLDMVQLTKGKECNLSDSRSPKTSKLERQKLKLHCLNLKDQLTQSKRMVAMLKKSKAKQASNFEERMQVMMEAYEKAQGHKRQLCDVIRDLKSSYFRLFPDEIFDGLHSKKSKHSQKHKTKIRNNHAEEDLVQKSKTWQTGKKICENGKDITKFPDDNSYENYLGRPTVVCFAEECQYHSS